MYEYIYKYIYMYRKQIRTLQHGDGARHLVQDRVQNHAPTQYLLQDVGLGVDDLFRCRGLESRPHPVPASAFRCGGSLFIQV